MYYIRIYPIMKYMLESSILLILFFSYYYCVFSSDLNTVLLLLCLCRQQVSKYWYSHVINYLVNFKSCKLKNSVQEFLTFNNELLFWGHSHFLINTSHSTKSKYCRSKKQRLISNILVKISEVTAWDCSGKND